MNNLQTFLETIEQRKTFLTFKEVCKNIQLFHDLSEPSLKLQQFIRTKNDIVFSKKHDAHSGIRCLPGTREYAVFQFKDWSEWEDISVDLFFQKYVDFYFEHWKQSPFQVQFDNFPELSFKIKEHMKFVNDFCSTETGSFLHFLSFRIKDLSCRFLRNGMQVSFPGIGELDNSDKSLSKLAPFVNAMSGEDLEQFEAIIKDFISSRKTCSSSTVIIGDLVL